MLTRRQSRDEARRGFTLAELLVVIGVMGIMLLLALPIFKQVGRGTAMDAAIVEVKEALTIARQWAITHREKTFLIFPDASTGTDAAGIAKAYKGFGIFAVTSMSGTNSVISGYYVREWDSLPLGVVFDGTLRSQSVFQPGNVLRAVPYPTASSVDKKDIFAIGFKPDGSTTGGATGYEIYIREGWSSVVTNPLGLDYGIKQGGLNRGVEVSGLVGTAKINEYP